MVCSYNWIALHRTQLPNHSTVPYVKVQFNLYNRVWILQGSCKGHLEPKVPPLLQLFPMHHLPPSLIVLHSPRGLEPFHLSDTKLVFNVNSVCAALTR